MNVHVRTCPFSDRKVDVKERYLSSSKIKCLGPIKGKENSVSDRKNRLLLMLKIFFSLLLFK